VAGGSAIRGSRVGAGPMGEAERGDAAPRLYVSYFCAHGHETRPAFADDAVIPDTWDCPRCGLPSNLDSLALVGIAYDDVIAELETQGVQAFIDAWNSLLDLVGTAAS